MSDCWLTRWRKHTADWEQYRKMYLLVCFVNGLPNTGIRSERHGNWHSFIIGDLA